MRDPHSSEMRVEERYHRVDRDTMELTVKIDDPKITPSRGWRVTRFASLYCRTKRKLWK